MKNNNEQNNLKKSQDTQVWLLSPGESARLWDEFKEKNIIAIGWGYLGNLNNYNNKKEIELELKKKYPSSTKQTNNIKALYEFSKEMKIGDIVFIKKGVKAIVGVGKITSDYKYSEIFMEHYYNTREVKWEKVGQWDLNKNTKLPSKTLTNITNDQKLCAKLNKLLDNGENESYAYTKENFLKEVLFLEKDYDNLVNLLKRKKNIILQGAPGVGKTFIAKRLAYSIIGGKNEDRIEFIQFHQSYSYEDFIQGYKPTESGFKLENGIFYKFCKKASKDLSNDYYFIIDEINRGNISKIFGELMMLIEEDKRGEDFAINLTYSDDKFYVPDNVYLIGMMNTADRSLAMIDYALRRRFVFYTTNPLFDNDSEHDNIFKNHLIEKGVNENLVDAIINKFTRLNKKILDDEDLGHGFRLGHSYFLSEGSYDKEWYDSIIEYEIAPILKEYWFDDLDKALDEIDTLKNISEYW